MCLDPLSTNFALKFAAVSMFVVCIFFELLICEKNLLGALSLVHAAAAATIMRLLSPRMPRSQVARENEVVVTHAGHLQQPVYHRDVAILTRRPQRIIVMRAHVVGIYAGHVQQSVYHRDVAGKTTLESVHSSRSAC